MKIGPISIFFGKSDTKRNSSGASSGAEIDQFKAVIRNLFLRPNGFIAERLLVERDWTAEIYVALVVARVTLEWKWQ